MYLWKYWRESRITFSIGLVLIGLLFWALHVHHVGPPLQGSRVRAQYNPDQIYMIVAHVLTLPLAFLALRYGSFGVGRDLNEGSGPFLFSRPRERTFFVWSDWCYGMAQLLLLVLAANLVVVFAAHRIAAESGPTFIADGSLSLLSIFCVNCVTGLLLTASMFSLTYFCSVLTRGRGVTLAVGVIVIYSIAGAVVNHYWPTITLPDLMLTGFSVSHSMIISFTDGLGRSIALRGALAMAFPIAAQLLLKQRDVD